MVVRLIFEIDGIARQMIAAEGFVRTCRFRIDSGETLGSAVNPCGVHSQPRNVAKYVEAAPTYLRPISIRRGARIANTL